MGFLVRGDYSVFAREMCHAGPPSSSKTNSGRRSKSSSQSYWSSSSAAASHSSKSMSSNSSAKMMSSIVVYMAVTLGSYASFVLSSIVSRMCLSKNFRKRLTIFSGIGLLIRLSFVWDWFPSPKDCGREHPARKSGGGPFQSGKAMSSRIRKVRI